LSFERFSHGSIIIHPCVVAIAPCTNIHIVLADAIFAASERVTILASRGVEPPDAQKVAHGLSIATWRTKLVTAKVIVACMDRAAADQ
jgi:hypothetical protein